MARLYSALIGLSLIWGLSFVFIKWLLEPAGVWGVVFIRCLAGATILLPILCWKHRQNLKNLPIKSLIVVGIFNAGLPWGLIALSETQVNSNIASVLNATTPIWTGLIGLFVYHVVLSKWQWIGIVFGFIGILILIDINLGKLAGNHFIGIGTMILAAVSYGFASQYTKRHLGEVGVVITTLFTLLVGAVVGLIGMIVTEPADFTALLSLKPALAIVGLGCFGSGIGNLLYFYMMKKGSPEFATTVTYLIPVSAMVWGYVLLGEPVTSNLFIGLLVIAVGVYLSTRKPKQI
jgi:drug/metabolite transporter (DMT)-like permease